MKRPAAAFENVQPDKLAGFLDSVVEMNHKIIASFQHLLPADCYNCCSSCCSCHYVYLSWPRTWGSGRRLPPSLFSHSCPRPLRERAVWCRSLSSSHGTSSSSTPNQSCFRRGFSTEMTLLSVHFSVVCALSCCLCTFLVWMSPIWALLQRTDCPFKECAMCVVNQMVHNVVWSSGQPTKADPCHPAADQTLLATRSCTY